MKRDMDLVRLILLEIEEEYQSTALINLSVDGYDLETVAYHCKIMYQAGLIDHYQAEYAGDGLYMFAVGSLTWEGHDYLDKVRDDSLWGKTKDAITKKGLPLVFDTIKAVANAFISAAVEGITNSIMKANGL